MTISQDKIKQIVTLFSESTVAIALTGAGVSTPSGIPDFRSPGSGLWNRVNPMDVASIIAFRQNPDKFYNWVRPLAQKVINAKPNPAHFALAQLEKAGKLDTVITQNIDGLHQMAGSKNVLEVHGHIRQFTCVRCYTAHQADTMLDEFLAEGTPPTCQCGGILKPNVILFGEQLPVQTMLDATNLANKADLILIAGSSLEVAPISDLPHDAHQRGAKIIIVNDQDTYLDAKADMVIRGDVARILPLIVNNILVTG